MITITLEPWIAWVLVGICFLQLIIALLSAWNIRLKQKLKKLYELT